MIQRLLLAAAMLLVVSACSSEPARRVFLLGSPLQIADPPATAEESAGMPALQLPTVSLPDYLDNEDILLRVGTHGLLSAAGARWGERLSAGITDSLTAALESRLPGYRVEPPRPLDPQALQVLVTVEAFDVQSDGRCELRASWTMQPSGSSGFLSTRRGVFTIPAVTAAAATDAGLVGAMAAAVDQLGAALALEVTTAPPAQASIVR